MIEWNNLSEYNFILALWLLYEEMRSEDGKKN